MLMRELTHVKEQFSQKNNELEERIKKLEEAKRKRMPWEALEELEHARAALNREKEEREFHISLIENAEAWIGKAMAAGTKREEKEE